MTPLVAQDLRNQVIHGDCIVVMQRMPEGSVDMVLTDPPYIVSYKDRAGRSVANDDHGRWLVPAFAEAYRVLKPGSVCVSFYGWNQVAAFVAAWRAAGFTLAGHLVFTKSYASSARLVRHQHEQAYILTKGRPKLPKEPLSDVVPFRYTGNHRHPTEKSWKMLQPLVESLCPSGGLVLDPFCGSGSSLKAAQASGRDFLGIELEFKHVLTAGRRVGFSPELD